LLLEIVRHEVGREKMARRQKIHRPTRSAITYVLRPGSFLFYVFGFTVACTLLFKLQAGLQRNAVFNVMPCF
jgi:hypothetical protein